MLTPAVIKQEEDLLYSCVLSLVYSTRITRIKRHMHDVTSTLVWHHLAHIDPSLQYVRAPQDERAMQLRKLQGARCLAHLCRQAGNPRDSRPRSGRTGRASSSKSISVPTGIGCSCAPQARSYSPGPPTRPCIPLTKTTLTLAPGSS